MALTHPSSRDGLNQTELLHKEQVIKPLQN